MRPGTTLVLTFLLGAILVAALVQFLLVGR